jgi:hypothetical protein
MMSPRLRKFALTAHIIASVGWIGAVAAFFVLAVAGLTSANLLMVQGAYLAMDLISWWIIVPCSVAALATGLIQSFGTSWGLLRHYWVLAKLLLTVVGTLILLVHMQPIARLAEAAPGLVAGGEELWKFRIQLVADSGLALLLLATTTALGIFKPWGRTRAS